MAFQVLVGKFRAKVLPFTFEQLGESPAIKAHLQPIGEYAGDELVPKEGMYPVNKAYFLSLDIQDKGKHAGKSGLEAVKADLKDSFGYEGPLEPSSMNAFVEGKEVDFVSQDNKGFTKVQYVNPVGQKGGKGKKPVKHLSPEEIAAWNAKWSGQTVASTPQDASSLFKTLTEGAKA
jgi:hypothetical protein